MPKKRTINGVYEPLILDWCCIFKQWRALGTLGMPIGALDVDETLTLTLPRYY